jgi:hypothetical protein
VEDYWNRYRRERVEIALFGCHHRRDWSSRRDALAIDWPQPGLTGAGQDDEP